MKLVTSAGVFYVFDEETFELELARLNGLTSGTCRP